LRRNPEPEENTAPGIFPSGFFDLHLNAVRRLAATTIRIASMIHVTRQTLWPVLAFGIVLATPAFAQAPSEAQRAAIKSNCRSDYMAHCSSIPPGGAASLQCLQQNMASLSAACAGAVKAVEGPAETESEPAAGAKEPAKQETKSEPAGGGEPSTTAAEPAKSESSKSESSKSASTKSEPAKTATKAAGKPSSAQIAAVRSNCRSDYPKVCAGVPTGGAPALQCLDKNKAKLSPACEKAVVAAIGGASAPAAASGGSGSGSGGATASANPGAGADAAPPPPLVLRPMMPREILFVLRSACGADVRSLCAGVPPGGGRIIECLATQSPALSPACRDVLGEFAAR
jgi:hypothetical protein